MKDKQQFDIGTYFTIQYYADKHDKTITRRGKWDMKCKIKTHYILYYDRDRSNYRYATNKLSPIHISIGLNKEEMKEIN